MVSAVCVPTEFVDPMTHVWRELTALSEREPRRASERGPVIKSPRVKLQARIPESRMVKSRSRVIKRSKSQLRRESGSPREVRESRVRKSTRSKSPGVKGPEVDVQESMSRSQESKSQEVQESRRQEVRENQEVQESQGVQEKEDVQEEGSPRVKL
ncbi:hypothetical protein PR002_g32442 [Phytophthora rubi]|uniref:Uncharacterized protein n=1 Tax=Phytophthora rubi TaxID=129364 RepID=A0A6A3G930_9STRA|nr:hypothetical protein PR002_g32442 [Phytophthora rubi]